MESGKWRVESGEWKVESGKWRVENGEWKVESGKWRVENGEWKMESGKWRVESHSESPASFIVSMGLVICIELQLHKRHFYKN